MAMTPTKSEEPDPQVAQPRILYALRDPATFKNFEGGVHRFYYGLKVGNLLAALSQAFGTDWPATAPYLLSLASLAVGPRAAFKPQPDSKMEAKGLLWELDVCKPGGTKSLIKETFDNLQRAVVLMVQVNSALEEGYLV